MKYQLVIAQRHASDGDGGRMDLNTAAQKTIRETIILR
jgi:hypothetical protein